MKKKKHKVVLPKNLQKIADYVSKYWICSVAQEGCTADGDEIYKLSLPVLVKSQRLLYFKILLCNQFIGVVVDEEDRTDLSNIRRTFKELRRTPLTDDNVEDLIRRVRFYG